MKVREKNVVNARFKAWALGKVPSLKLGLWKIVPSLKLGLWKIVPSLKLGLWKIVPSLKLGL